MEKQEFIKQANKELLDLFTIKSIQAVNHKPHPYCITEKHITGQYVVLNDTTIKEQEREAGKSLCGMYINPDNPKEYTNGHKRGWIKCDKLLDEHTADMDCFLKQQKNATVVQLNAEMVKLEEFRKQKDIKYDGYALIEPDENVKIIENKIDL